jgi:hypothetical protein
MGIREMMEMWRSSIQTTRLEASDIFDFQLMRIREPAAIENSNN